MKKLIYSMMVSLDGYIESSDGKLEWAIVDEELHRYIINQEREHSAHLYGRKMYEIMNAYWPNAEADPALPDFMLEYAQICKNLKKIVVSTSLEIVDGNDLLLRGNLAKEVSKLKSEPGEDIVVGGSQIAASLMALGLIDEYQMFIHPVILGGGTPMFPQTERQISLQLIDRHFFTSGVVFIHYRGR